MSGLQIDRPQRAVSNWVSGILVVALLIGAVLMAFLENGGAIATGGPAPAFGFERYTGGRVSSEQLKGRVVMLDFWATWCPPCVEEMPMLVALAKEYEAKGVTFVAANDPDDSEEDLTTFINHTVPAVRPYAAYGDRASVAGFRVRALPTIYILDRQGTIIGSQTGQVSERKVRAWLDQALLGAQ